MGKVHDSEGVACAMPECCLWNHGGSITVLQEICEESHKARVQDQSYDGCVANKVIKGKQITICFHVNDCKIFHESSKVIDDTIDWLQSEYKSILKMAQGQ